jgi:hypothetical protein
MARHKRTCKIIAWYEKCEKLQEMNTKFAHDNTELVKKNARLEHQLSEIAQQNSDMEERLKELQTRLDECRNSRPNVQNNVTINIVPYGREEPLTNAQVRSILSSIPSESVPKYIEMKHFRRPENSNIRITNKRGRTLQIVEEDTNKRLRWVDKDRKTMLSAITDTSLEELIDHFDAEKYKSWNNWFETSGLKDEGYDKTDAFKEIMTKVENMITSQSPKNAI